MSENLRRFGNSTTAGLKVLSNPPAPKITPEAKAEVLRLINAKKKP
jgi:hypothetical protein